VDFREKTGWERTKGSAPESLSGLYAEWEENREASGEESLCVGERHDNLAERGGENSQSPVSPGHKRKSNVDNFSHGQP